MGRSADDAVRPIGELAALDPTADALAAAIDAAAPAGVRRALQGTSWLGHPLHPLLTDLPIGFWTSAFVLDLVGGAGSRDASRQLVAWGVVSALPTAAAGLADWPGLDRRGRRIGLVHAAANGMGTLCYGLSWWARRRGHQRAGVVWGLAGATAATVGGSLGGYLVFGAEDPG
jgi:uncharacterized membrane protein